MPYASDKQRKWAHTASAKKAGFPTEEFDAEERKKRKRKHMSEAMRRAHREFNELESNPYNNQR